MRESEGEGAMRGRLQEPWLALSYLKSRSLDPLPASLSPGSALTHCRQSKEEEKEGTWEPVRHLH